MKFTVLKGTMRADSSSEVAGTERQPPFRVVLWLLARPDGNHVLARTSKAPCPRHRFSNPGTGHSWYIHG